ncbi:hypothetical protein [Methanobrevibacter sp.]|uniref:hypothetical protein n=1 Tax=Methanobrevibacter sp. TaxID=66852 RepID=UPI00386FDE1F
MNNESNLAYKKYDDSQAVIQRQIKFKKEIAEGINKTMAEFKATYYGLRMNNDILVNIALSYYLSFIESLEDDEAMELLKDKVISYELEEIK